MCIRDRVVGLVKSSVRPVSGKVIGLWEEERPIVVVAIYVIDRLGVRVVDGKESTVSDPVA